MRILHGLLTVPLAASACLAMLSCSSPTLPDPPEQPQRFVDELQWYEMSQLTVTGGDAGEDGWIADVLSDQLAGRNLLLEFDGGSIQSGVADIQLEYDDFPIASAWSSPPGELLVVGNIAALRTSINFSHDPDNPAAQQVVERTSIEGSFSAAEAEELLRHAQALRSAQPIPQTNPETSELWLLGRSPHPLVVHWELEGTLGGVPFSFSASQELTAVSSYYEVTILNGQAESGAEVDKLHRTLLSALD